MPKNKVFYLWSKDIKTKKFKSIINLDNFYPTKKLMAALELFKVKVLLFL